MVTEEFFLAVTHATVVVAGLAEIEMRWRAAVAIRNEPARVVRFFRVMAEILAFEIRILNMLIIAIVCSAKLSAFQ